MKLFLKTILYNKIKNDYNSLYSCIKETIDYLQKNIIKTKNEQNGIIDSKDLKKFLNNLGDKYNINNNILTGLSKTISDYLKKYNNNESINLNDQIDNNEFFKNIENKKFYIILDNVNNKDYLKTIDNIVSNNYLSYHFEFIIIISLNNEFIYRYFFNYLSNGNKFFFRKF